MLHWWLVHHLPIGKEHRSFDLQRGYIRLCQTNWGSRPDGLKFIIKRRTKLEICINQPIVATFISLIFSLEEVVVVLVYPDQPTHISLIFIFFSFLVSSSSSSYSLMHDAFSPFFFFFFSEIPFFYQVTVFQPVWVEERKRERNRMYGTCTTMRWLPVFITIILLYST